MYIFIYLQYILFYASEFKIVYFWDFRSKSWWSNFFPIFDKASSVELSFYSTKVTILLLDDRKKKSKNVGFLNGFYVIQNVSCVIYDTNINITHNLWSFNGFFFHCVSFKLTRENEKEMKKVNEKVILMILFDGFVWVCFNSTINFFSS